MKYLKKFNETKEYGDYGTYFINITIKYSEL